LVLSLGDTRELVLAQDDSRLYFPQANHSVLSYGRNVNLRFKHGTNPLKDGNKGRIAILIYGQAKVEDEGDSPSLLKRKKRKPRRRKPVKKGEADPSGDEDDAQSKDTVDA